MMEKDIIRLTDPVPGRPGDPPMARMDVSGVKRKFLDLSYGTLEGQKLDLYLPREGEGPFPTVVFLHGGAFWGGDKRDFQALYAMDGIFRGYAVASVNYHLSEQVQFPQQLYDAKAALAFLKTNAARFALDPGRFCLMGNSAGAYLATMAALTPNVPAFAGPAAGQDTGVAAVVGLFGVYDLAAQSHFTEEMRLSPDPEVPKVDNFADLFLGTDCRQAPGLLSLTWPGSYVTPQCPPMLLQAGTGDTVVPWKSSVELVDRVNAVCGQGRAQLQLFEGWPHGDDRYASPENEDRLFSYIEKYL